MKNKTTIMALEGMEENESYSIVIDNSFIDAENSLGEQDSSNDKIDSIVDSAIAISDIATVLNNSDSENISSTSIAALSTAVEHFCKKCELHPNPVFALETFNSKVTRKKAMTLALE